MKYKKTKIFLQIIKNSFLWKALIGYFVFFGIASVIIWILEPSVKNFGDSLWYCFVSSSTIGFGDIAVAGTVGRIVTVILYFYSVMLLALVTSVFTQFFFEMAKAKRNDSIEIFQYDIEHLQDLPKDRLAEISEKIKKLKRKSQNK